MEKTVVLREKKKTNPEFALANNRLDRNLLERLREVFQSDFLTFSISS